MLKVKVANTPEESVDVSAPEIASAKPPWIAPLLLSHNADALPVKVVASPPVLTARKGPSVTFTNCNIVAFQVTEDNSQPQDPGELSIRISILIDVERGFGVGPTVMLEVLVEPDFTALIVGAEVLAMLKQGIARGKVTSRMIVIAMVTRFFNFSFFAPPEFQRNDILK